MRTDFETFDPCCLDLSLPLAGEGCVGPIRPDDGARTTARQVFVLSAAFAAALHGCIFGLLAALGMGAGVPHRVISVSLLPVGVLSGPPPGDGSGRVSAGRAAPQESLAGPVAPAPSRTNEKSGATGQNGRASVLPKSRPARPAASPKSRIEAGDATAACRPVAGATMQPQAMGAELGGGTGPDQGDAFNASAPLALTGQGQAGAASGSGHSQPGGGIGTAPVRADFDDSDGPRFVHRVLPQYPEVARRRGREGRVVLRLVIGVGGELKDAAVVEGGGHGFEEAALKAVRASVYAPAVRGGRPVECAAMLPVRFALKGS